MPALKEGEVMAPFRGVADTQVRGEGLIDFLKKKDAPDSGNYIDLSLEFLDEGGTLNPMETYAEIRLTNNLEALIEDGLDPEVAGYIVDAADSLTKVLKHFIRRGGRYGD